jgi:hypothetical protein
MTFEDAMNVKMGQLDIKYQEFCRLLRDPGIINPRCPSMEGAMEELRKVSEEIFRLKQVRADVEGA